MYDELGIGEVIELVGCKAKRHTQKSDYLSK